MSAAGTTARTGFTLDLRRARHSEVAGWVGKREALATLAALRDRGLNLSRDIEAHRAETHLTRFWVIGRPDHFYGITYLMTDDGRWIPGRLTDTYTGAVPWSRLAGDPEPATVTHAYGYSAGSTGVCGHDGKPLMTGGGLYSAPTEVLSWMASAWCLACTWSTHDDREETVRAAARWHRAHPEGYASHATPRRRQALTGAR